MKRTGTILLFMVFCAGIVFGAPRVKIVTQYVTPQMLSTTSQLTADSTVSNGLSTVAKGTYVYFKAWNFGDATEITSATWTLLQKPAGSTATISQITGLAWWSRFKADLTGAYQVQVSIVTSSGTKDTTATIYAATYVGTGGFDNVPAAFPNCMSCHSGNNQFTDIFNRWKLTVHATGFKTNITSGSSSYGINRFKTQTLGYDHNLVAENNGFDDKARELGWNWSNYSPPKAGNWDSLKNRFPSLVAFANVGCESCHGAGSEHVFNGGDTTRIQRSVDEGVCGKCHDSQPYAPEFTQYKNSMHSGTVWSSSFAQNNNGTNNLDNCIRCHDGQAYVNFTKGEGTITNGFTVAKQEMIACATCHDPHGNSNPYGLRNRPANSDTLANGYHYTNVGKSAVCMDCHKSRKNNVAFTNTRVNSAHWGPHYSGQTDIYQGQNAASFGASYQNTAHSQFLVNGCVTCHMAPTDTTSANKDKVGGHSMSMHNPETNYDNVNGCKSCHAGKTRFDQFMAPQDYDGDSNVESWIDEFDGCVTNLRISLPPVGIDSVAWQLIAADSNNVTLRKSYFNYLLLTEEGSHGMHNPKYAIDVLIQSRNALIGIINYSNEVPGRFELSQNYPNPFNPTTKFKFSLPRQNDVKIVVFDIMGREVKTLVNEKNMVVGKYEVDWDGTNGMGNHVSSGVYFYKIVAGDFVETKKMIMLK